MTNQIPRGPDNLYCSRWHKKMSAVCHTCNLWIKLDLTDRTTGKRIDEWRCSEAWTPFLLVEIASKALSGAAATENLTAELTKRADTAAQQRLGQSHRPPLHLIESE